jgi:DNA-binding transcriptional LysR family regulator
MHAMETKWLEDFVSLAETRSFSRSAQLRHVTQPAFSRRIQALEAWAGVDLVDRSAYPTRLTPAGQTLYAQALEVLHGLQSARAMLRAHTGTTHDVVSFAVPHTLAFTFFPAWVSQLRALRAAQEPADRAQCARCSDASRRGRLGRPDRLPPPLAALAARPRALRHGLARP